MEEAGFEEIGVYIIRSQNTFAQYITTRPIMDLCERSVCRTGALVSLWWWWQEGIDIEGAKERSAAESGGEKYKCGEVAAQEETRGWNLRQGKLR